MRGMTTDLAQCAADIAPHLDRLRMGVMRASMELGMKSGILAGAGLDPDTFTVFAMLRNAYPDRAVRVENYRAAYIYHDPEKFSVVFELMLRSGHVVEVDQTVVLSPTGRELMTKVREVGAQAANDMWGEGPHPVLALADRCVAAAATTASSGGAFWLVAPPHDEPADSEAARLAERLTCLRWHRFDAHVSAWRAKGLSATEAGELGPGPLSDDIEADTNERAGTAYAPLSPQERASLISALAALS
jgi:hypothetical protein